MRTALGQPSSAMRELSGPRRSARQGRAPLLAAAKQASERQRPAERADPHAASGLSNNITPLRRTRPSARAADADCATAAADGASEAPAPAPLLERQSSSLGAADWAVKPAALVLGSSYILNTAVQLSSGGAAPPLVPILAGAAVGTLYALLYRAGVARLWRAPRAPLNVVVTGGRSGLGKALAREFLLSGDRVFITARNAAGVAEAVEALAEEADAAGRVGGAACDVSVAADVERLLGEAQAFFGAAEGADASQAGPIDVWLNNAGYSGTFQSFLEARPEQIEEVVRTNLIGTLLCSRAAMRAMQGQPSGGHIFNMDGAGADGMATPQYTAYGATKAGIAHAYKSLQHETRGSGVAVHTLSPGMVLTPLLLEGATDENKSVFNILCEHPETSAAYLVPRARTVVARGSRGAYVRFLTLPRALARFLSAPFRANKFFDAEGLAVYPPERERLATKRTERLARRVARRSHELGLAYSFSLAASYLLLITEWLPKA